MLHYYPDSNIPALRSKEHLAVHLGSLVGVGFHAPFIRAADYYAQAFEEKTDRQPSSMEFSDALGRAVALFDSEQFKSPEMMRMSAKHRGEVLAMAMLEAPLADIHAALHERLLAANNGADLDKRWSVFLACSRDAASILSDRLPSGLYAASEYDEARGGVQTLMSEHARSALKRDFPADFQEQEVCEALRLLNEKNGSVFIARTVREGQHFGNRKCLVHDDACPMIEFYLAHESLGDAKALAPEGYFVSRYMFETILEHVTKRHMEGRSQGIQLEGNDPELSLSENNVRDVVAWHLIQDRLRRLELGASRPTERNCPETSPSPII